MQALRLTSKNKAIGPVDVGQAACGIGRHPDNQITIRDDLASRFHCAIEPDDNGRLHLKDLGSRNGTKLNGERITEVALSHGDVITVGRHTFAVTEIELTAVAAEASPAFAEADGQEFQPDETVSVADAPAPPKEQPKPQRAPSIRFKPAGKPSQRTGDADWVRKLRDVIESLPPKTSADEMVALIDSKGNQSESLMSDNDGPVAARLILLAASKARATDIHVEPKGESYSLRLRVDGQMVAIVEFPQGVGDLVLGIVRTACQMKQASRDAVQDGSFSAMFNRRRVDFRASLTPTIYGPKLVARILDVKTAPQKLSDMYLPAYMHERIQKICERDTGLLLTCGPTGSGKTTTLYNAMREMDREVRNVVTIEDPVEYYIDNVTQIPVDRNSSFPEILRSVLRQDPDAILVGEIRDEETARVAMQAAMTGHVVLSTVHAKDSIGSVFRLLDLGVEPYLVANSLDIVLAQRLMRVLCDNCKREVKVTPAQASKIGRYLERKDAVYAATGCSKCLRTGYLGRRAVFEMLTFDDDLRDIVLSNPTIQAMRKKVTEGVFTTLQQSGWVLAANGETSLDEVERVVGSGGG